MSVFTFRFATQSVCIFFVTGWICCNCQLSLGQHAAQNQDEAKLPVQIQNKSEQLQHKVTRWHVRNKPGKWVDGKMELAKLGLRGQSAKTLMALARPITIKLAEQAADPVDDSLISNFWIGVQCEKAGETSYSPNEAPEAELVIDGGMKILAVTEGSASDEAGLEEGDVLLKFAGKKMNALNDLYAVIGENEDHEANVLLIRDGKLLQLQITPQKRPEKSDDESSAAGLSTIQDAIQNELTFQNELIEFPNKSLPEGYRLQFELVQGKDISIKVMQGDDNWQANDETIDELPEPVREVASEIVTQCKPMVTADPNRMYEQWLNFYRNQNAQLPHVSPLVWRIQSQSSNDRLDAVQKQLRELTEAVNKLKTQIDDE